MADTPDTTSGGLIPPATSIRAAYLLGRELARTRTDWDAATAVDYVAVGFRPWIAQQDGLSAGRSILRWAEQVSRQPLGRLYEQFSHVTAGRSDLPDDDLVWDYPEFTWTIPQELLPDLDPWDDGAANLLAEARVARLRAGDTAVPDMWCAADVLWRGMIHAPTALEVSVLVEAGLRACGLPATSSTLVPASVTEVFEQGISLGLHPSEAVQLALLRPEAYQPL
jgi:hypothetical protein